MKAIKRINESYQILEIVNPENLQQIKKFFKEIEVGNVICEEQDGYFILFDNQNSMQNLTWKNSNKRFSHSVLEDKVISIAKKPKKLDVCQIENKEQLKIAKIFNNQSEIGDWIVAYSKYHQELVKKKDFEDNYQLV